MIYENVIDMIGETPILKLNEIEGAKNASIYVKLEKYNPGGSTKDRAALGMIEEAERLNLLKAGGTIVEPTSGNTGIALAMIGRKKGYKVIIVMPETMSIERRNIISAYGAKLILTEGSKGMKGAILKAEEIAKETGAFLPQQFLNKANPLKHYETTAEEILRDIPNIDYFVAGVGTGGTITGVSKKLKELKKDIKVIAVEPASSPVLSGGNPGPHKIQGIGAGFIPENYDDTKVDKIIQVKNEDAEETARKIALEEGVLLGISSGAAIYAALSLSKGEGSGKNIVVVAPDGGEKYLSLGIYGVR